MKTPAISTNEWRISPVNREEQVEEFPFCN